MSAQFRKSFPAQTASAPLARLGGRPLPFLLSDREQYGELERGTSMKGGDVHAGHGVLQACLAIRTREAFSRNFEAQLMTSSRST